MRLMEIDQDVHHFTGRWRSRSAVFDSPTIEQVLLQIGQKPLAKIIDIAEQFE
jgi:hypothetical protein